MGKRAAVVIGVNSTGGLPPLKAAIGCAKDVAIFLKNEHFEVTLLTDELEPVTVAGVFLAIEAYVKPPTRYEMLVVYFSGHGYYNNWVDQWLLSGAPTNSSEAINLDKAVDLAGRSGIPNVVFVSDACRSRPVDLAGASIDGSPAYPNRVLSPSKVDVFRATLPAKVAYEAEKQNKQFSFLTTAFLAAYSESPEDIVRLVRVDGQDIRVVPNRRLEDFLQKRIDELIEDVDPNLIQTIEATVPSRDDVFIGRAHRMLPPPPTVNLEARFETRFEFGLGAEISSTRPPRKVSVGKAAAELVRELVLTDRSVEDLERRGGLRDEINAQLPIETEWNFPTQTGFVVYDVAVRRVVASSIIGPATAEIDPSRPNTISVRINKPGCSVGVEYGDGKSMLLPALRGYIGHCVVNKVGLANVSYVPAYESSRWRNYVVRRGQVDSLRAAVAVAAGHNSFSFSSEKEASRFADSVRREKVNDPTLGLYAAYAYSQAGDDKKIQSLLRYMRDDLDINIFDVRMLAYRDPEEDILTPRLPTLPACPMLTRGWNLIENRHLRLPKVLRGGERHLTGSLWTTFEHQFTSKLFDAINAGEI